MEYWEGLQNYPKLPWNLKKVSWKRNNIYKPGEFVGSMFVFFGGVSCYFASFNQAPVELKQNHDTLRQGICCKRFMAICHFWPLSQALIKLLQVTSLGATSPQIKQSLSLGHFPTPRLALEGTNSGSTKSKHDGTCRDLSCWKDWTIFHVLVVATSTNL